jgi:hypothetical protein
MAKNQQDQKAAEDKAAAKKAEAEAKKAEAAAKENPEKIFEKMTIEDLGALKRGIDEVRSYANSSMSECIRVSTAYQSYHYTDRAGETRDKEQDKRVREGAKLRGADAVRNLKDYLQRLEEEIRGLRKTI